MNIFNITKSFNIMKQRKWPYVYWFIDIHETILLPDWSDEQRRKIFYPNAKRMLRKITNRDDIKVVMYTCSHKKEIEEYIEFFRSYDIEFDFINENPETTNTKYGDFTKKPYMNVILDDKAGFEAKSDWFLIESELLKEDGKMFKSIMLKIFAYVKSIIKH